jgi:hypothetical protein
MAGVARPPARERRSPTVDAARPPHVESCSDSVLSLRQEVLLRCSGTVAKGPVWWWPSRCGGVCPHFASFSAFCLLEGTMSTSVCWWACAAVASSPLRLWCIVVCRIVVRSC